jgi:tetratricopeptide (TPR) repeat protein
MSTQQLIDEAADLREKGDAKAAIEVLLEAHELDPQDPDIDLQIAMAHDSIGQEAKAIPHYERAIANGLAGEDRLLAYVGLGSSLRALGRYEAAARALDAGLGEYPDSRVLETFRIMVRFNEGEHQQAFEQLLDLHARSCGDEQVRTYRGALQLYAEDIAHVYE